MMQHCWPILLLCLSANAENIAVCREPGENVTLLCSSEGCLKDYVGMYLYHKFKERQEVLYYHHNPGSTHKITPRERYENRIQIDGPLKNHTITISNLTVDDSGFYSCVYKQFPTGEAKCNVYTLFVRGVASCSSSEEVPCAPANEKSLPLVVIIVATGIISTLVTLIFILLIIPSVKQWATSRRRPTSVPQVSSDYVYEEMTKNGLRPLPGPQQ